MKKMNSTEIAKLAGVSRSTVSRVINGYANVPEETKNRVMRAIQEHEYYPLLSGQLLAGKKTKTLGFFWVSNSSIASDLQSSAYFVHVVESAAKLGYLVLTCIVPDLKEEENIQWVKRMFLQERIDGGIFIGVNNHEPLIEELISKGKVVGIFDHFHEDRCEPNRISANFETDTGEKMIEYVYRLGHRNIALVDGNMNRYSMIKRHEGFLRGMQRHNLDIRREWMCYADLTEESGYLATREMLQQCTSYPTVICAANDAIAFGVYRALAEKQLSIPQQVSVIGIDGHERARFMNPPLTTFAMNYETLFFSLVQRTIAAIEQTGDYEKTVFIPSTLIKRDSCIPVKTKSTKE